MYIYKSENKSTLFTCDQIWNEIYNLVEHVLRLVSNVNVWIYAKQITIMEGGVILVHPLNSYVILSVSNASVFVCEPTYISEFLSLIR